MAHRVGRSAGYRNRRPSGRAGLCILPDFIVGLSRVSWLLRSSTFTHSHTHTPTNYTYAAQMCCSVRGRHGRTDDQPPTPNKTSRTSAPPYRKYPASVCGFDCVCVCVCTLVPDIDITTYARRHTRTPTNVIVPRCQVSGSAELPT